MNAGRLLALGAAAVAVVMVVWVGWVGFRGGMPATSPAPGSLLRPDDLAVTARGAQVYAAQCAACHGARLEGQPDWRTRNAQGLLPAPPHDATGHTWHHDDALLVRITKLGVARAAGLQGYASAMPAYEQMLSDGEIIAVLSWIKSQWPADVRAHHDEINRQAARR
jgi:S-disulfanyl-L-cysteine oxidoreductase SoxD